MTLLSLQRAMRAWLVDADEAAVASLGEGARPGLGVYQNNYRAQLVACLELSFARTLAWIGEAAFLSACAHHIDRVPPSSWTLDAYARDFPATLALLHEDDPEIAEIATIELALEDAFVAPDRPALGLNHLQDVDWDSAVLHLSPTLELIDTATNAFAIWSALVEETTPPAAVRLDRVQTLLVWRQEHQVRLRPIDSLEHGAIMQARASVSFAALCEAAANHVGQRDAAVRVGTWLGQWISDGLIVAIDCPDA